MVGSLVTPGRILKGRSRLHHHFQESPESLSKLAALPSMLREALLCPKAAQMTSLDGDGWGWSLDGQRPLGINVKSSSKIAVLEGFIFVNPGYGKNWTLFCENLRDQIRFQMPASQKVLYADGLLLRKCAFWLWLPDNLVGSRTPVYLSHFVRP